MVLSRPDTPLQRNRPTPESFILHEIDRNYSLSLFPKTKKFEISFCRTDRGKGVIPNVHIRLGGQSCPTLSSLYSKKGNSLDILTVKLFFLQMQKCLFFGSLTFYLIC